MRGTHGRLAELAAPLTRSGSRIRWVQTGIAGDYLSVSFIPEEGVMGEILLDAAGRRRVMSVEVV